MPLYVVEADQNNQEFHLPRVNPTVKRVISRVQLPSQGTVFWRFWSFWSDSVIFWSDSVIFWSDSVLKPRTRL